MLNSHAVFFPQKSPLRPLNSLLSDTCGTIALSLGYPQYRQTHTGGDLPSGKAKGCLPPKDFFSLENVSYTNIDTGRTMVLLHLCIMRVVQWFALLSQTECGFEPWPLDFTRTVFIRVKLQFLPTVQRNIGQELSGAVRVCGVFICVSSIINCQPVVSPRLLHTALGSIGCDLERREKQEEHSEKKTFALDSVFMCSGIRFIQHFTYCSFFIFQTWKTSRLTEGAPCLSVKVKEWFCCVAHHHILEVKRCTFSLSDCSTQMHAER